jgi:hypothetical protein
MHTVDPLPGKISERRKVPFRRQPPGLEAPIWLGDAAAPEAAPPPTIQRIAVYAMPSLACTLRRRA